MNVLSSPPTHAIATAISFEVVSTKPVLGWLLQTLQHFSMASLAQKMYSFVHARWAGENNNKRKNWRAVERFRCIQI